MPKVELLLFKNRYPGAYATKLFKLVADEEIFAVRRPVLSTMIFGVPSKITSYRQNLFRFVTEIARESSASGAREWRAGAAIFL